MKDAYLTLGTLSPSECGAGRHAEGLRTYQRNDLAGFADDIVARVHKWKGQVVERSSMKGSGSKIPVGSRRK